MNIAQLGVGIDSGPAKKGSDDVKGSLKGIATEARTTTAAVEGVVRATEKLAPAAATIRTTTTATKDMTQANSALSQSARIAADGLARESQIFGDLFKQIEAGKAQITAVQTGMTAAAAATKTATTASSGFVAALAPFGGPVGAGIIAALTIVPMVLEKIRERTEAARKEAIEYRRALAELSPAALEAAKNTELAFQNRIRSTPMSAGARSAALAESDARLNPILGAIGAQQTQAAMAFSKVLQDNQRELLNTAERIAVFRKEGKLAAEAYGAAAAQWDRAGDSVRTFGQALAAGDQKAQQLLISQRQVATANKTLTDAMDDGSKAAREDARAREAWAKKVTEIMADVERVVLKSEEAQRAATEKRNKAIGDGEAKIAGLIEARDRENAILAEQIKQLNGTANAYDTLNEAQAETKAIAEALSKLPPGVLLDPDTEARIRAQVKEWYTLNDALKDAKKRADALRGWDGKSPFTLPNDNGKDAREFANALRDAAMSAGDIAAAFGGAGQSIGKAINEVGRLASAYERMKAANADGEPKSGLGAALGQIAPAASVFATFVGISTSLMNSMRADAERRNQLQQEFAKSVEAFGKSVERDGLSTVQRARATLGDTVAEQVAKALATTGAKLTSASPGFFDPTAAGLRSLQSTARFTAGNTPDGRAAGALNAFADAIDAFIATTEAAEAALKKQQETALKAASDDVRVQILSAQGRTAEAEAMRRQLDLQRQIDEAARQFDGLDGLAEYVNLLKLANDAAREAADAERARQQATYGLDIDARRNALAGNDRAAFGLRAQSTRDNALAEAQGLFAAGKITADMLANLSSVITDEFNQSLSDFDTQVRNALQATRDDLAVRQLVALGFDKAAEQARIDIANRKELEGITDDNIRQQIEYVQGLEAEARARADVIDTQNTWLDINQRTANALKVLNPAAAAALEAQIKQAKRDIELANAKDDVIRKALQEVYALEDQADAMLAAAEAAQAVTDAIQKQSDAMNALADLSLSITDEYLRATGRTFDADKNALGRKRDERIGAVVSGVAAAAGPAPIINPADPTSFIRFAQWQEKFAGLQAQAQDDIGKINATYNANLDKLIRDQMAGGSSATSNYSLDGGTRSTGRDAGGMTLGGDTVSYRSAASITETSAMRLIDYAASSNRHLARLVQLAEGGRSTGGADLLPGLARAVDRQMGSITADQALMIFGRIA